MLGSMSPVERLEPKPKDPHELNSLVDVVLAQGLPADMAAPDITNWATMHWSKVVEHIVQAKRQELASALANPDTAEQFANYSEAIVRIDARLNQLDQDIKSADPDQVMDNMPEANELLDQGEQIVNDVNTLLHRSSETAALSTDRADEVSIHLLATTPLGKPASIVAALRAAEQLTGGRISAETTVYKATDSIKDVRPNPTKRSVGFYTGHGADKIGNQTAYRLKTTAERVANNPAVPPSGINVEKFEAYTPPVALDEFGPLIVDGIKWPGFEANVMLDNNQVAAEMKSTGMREAFFTTCFSSDLGMALIRQCPELERVAVFNGLLPVGMANKAAEFVALSYTVLKDLRLAFHAGMQALHDYYQMELTEGAQELENIDRQLADYKAQHTTLTPADAANTAPLRKRRDYLKSYHAVVRDCYIPKMDDWRLISRAKN